MYSITLVQSHRWGQFKLVYQNLVAGVTIVANDDLISLAVSTVIVPEEANATFVVV